MGDGDLTVVWIALGRLTEKGYAVAIRQVLRGFHVRAVKEGKIVEAECPTMSEAIMEIHEKTRRKKELESTGK